MSSWDPTRQKPLLEWALYLRSLGLSLLPIKGGTKKPAVKWEELQARQATEEELIRWLKGDNQLAIITGEVSGVVVIDTDSAEAEIWARQNLPETPIMCQTPKGWHRYYKWPGHQVSNKARIKTDIEGLALDLRGDGGYVLAPGSLHPDGEKYLAWGRWSGFGDLPPYRKTWEPLERARLWLQKRDPAIEGQGGDQWTFKTACELIGFGLAESQVVELLQEWNATCRPPWTTKELEQKARNAYRYSKNAPGCKLGQSASGVASVRPKTQEKPEVKSGLLDKVYPLSAIYLSLAEAKAAGTDTAGFVYSGIPPLDAICKGFRPAQFVLIGARPSIGKTAFGFQLARAIARRFGPVYFESLEMGADEMGTRGAQQALQLRGESLTVEHFRDLAAKDEEPVYISVAGRDGFRERIRQFLFDHPGTAAIFADHLGFLIEHKPGSNTYSETSAVSQMLKETAVEFNLPMFAMAQLGRDNEKEKRKPDLTDLRGSGNLEQDADKVLFIHRERTDSNGDAEIIVAKNRGGPTGVVHLSWRGHTTTFCLPGAAKVEAAAKQANLEFVDLPAEAVDVY